MLAREVIQRVREIQVRTGRQVADVLAGQYVSVFKGRGIEFDEVRPYVPGDEIRTIDWKVTARLGHPYVKRFVEERQLTLMLMADISASQDFGSATRSKREVAAELWYEALPLLPGAVELVRDGIVPGGTKRNLEHVVPWTAFAPELSDWQRLLVADAQTSGGLLLAVPPSALEATVASLKWRGVQAAAAIGRVKEQAGPLLTVGLRPD